METILAAFIIACSQLSSNAPAGMFNNSYLILKQSCIQRVTTCVKDNYKESIFGTVSHKIEVADKCAPSVNLDGLEDITNLEKKRQKEYDNGK